MQVGQIPVPHHCLTPLLPVLPTSHPKNPLSSPLSSLPSSPSLPTQPLETVDFNEPISPSLERRVLTTMISICESYLEQYPTRVEDDEALMMNRVEYGKSSAADYSYAYSHIMSSSQAAAAALESESQETVQDLASQSPYIPYLQSSVVQCSVVSGYLCQTTEQLYLE